VKARPTLAQAQAQRAERDALYQEQLRQRFGDRPPEKFARRGEQERPPARPPGRPPERQSAAPSNRGPARTPNTAFEPRQDARRPRSEHAQPPQHQEPQRFDVQRFEAERAQRQRAEPQRGEPPRSGSRAPAGTRPPIQREARPPLRPAQRFDPRAERHDPRHDARRRPHDDDDDDDIRDDPPEHAPGSVRLSKRMSELGIASRREADEWIAKGWVRVDDQVVSELGSRVMPNQRVTVDAKAKFQQAQKVTVLINKPVGYVSGQAEDGYEPALVLVTPQNLWNEDRSGTRFLREHLRSLVPAGRLDIDSVGLLVLTQDGRVAKQLIGEDSEIEKEYLVRVASADSAGLSDEGLALLRHGLELDGEALRPAHVEWVNDDQLRFVLTQGKKRQIRRMCEAVGLQVLGLKRVRIGKVMLGDLPAGQWRYLRADESFG
jgi:23S rRNA pseudouridine2604 synthase